MSTPAEITNAKLEKIIPEIAASRYGKYPMHGIRWLHVTEDKNPDGENCYIKGPFVGPKTDYVFGPGTHGELYYHLLTKPSYVILANRLEKGVPKGIWEICAFFSSCFSSIEARQEAKDRAEVCNIIYMRAKASIPDDEQARRDNLLDAKGEAQADFWFSM
jgi:hypothetical protein